MNGFDELFGRTSLGIEDITAKVVDLSCTDDNNDVLTTTTTNDEIVVNDTTKSTCTKCLRLLHSDVVYRPCGHSYHTQCLIDLVVANRRWCIGCPLPSAPHAIHSGYAMDTGNDPCSRSAIMASLEYRRQKVRVKLGALYFYLLH